MFLCFWLVILFLDGAFSSKDVSVQETISSSTSASLQALAEASGTSLAPVSQVATMVSGVIHQSLGNSQIFQDLNVLEYL